jgi:hypothetical protein
MQLWALWALPPTPARSFGPNVVEFNLLPTHHDLLGRTIGMCLDKYEAQVFAVGVNLELQTDFRHLAEINHHLGKAPLTPQLNPDVSDINPLNGFWLKGVHGRR